MAVSNTKKCFNKKMFDSPKFRKGQLSFSATTPLIIVIDFYV